MFTSRFVRCCTLVLGVVGVLQCTSTPDVALLDAQQGTKGAAGTTGSGGATVNLDLGGAGGAAGAAVEAGAGGTGPVCGDGHLDVSEECDDGNAIPGDGCSGICKLEPGYSCPTAGKPCTYVQLCGDGIIQGNEACDDGNQVSGDGCSDSCEPEPGYSCSLPGQPCVPSQTPVCGNGRVEFGETCDDGNARPGDGCDASCKLEPGFHCPKPGSQCVANAVCGDGALNPGEECDDGNTKSGDGCDGACHIEGADWNCSTPGKLCVTTIVCGDGRVEAGEGCDDGNTKPGDGCTATCTVESGWSCPPGGGKCWTRCGDGVIAGAEQCDDGNNAVGDGCSPICQLELGFKCTGAVKSLCTRTVCGDGTKEGLEQCDDGNTLPFDGCSPLCTNEPNCADSVGNRAPCQAVCGDGIVFPSEQCDDGNTRDGDGCSSRCQVESGYVCESSGIPNTIALPAVFRDSTPGAPTGAGHTDFQWSGVPSNPGNLWGNPNGAYFNAGATSANRINYTFDGLTQGLVRVALGNAGDVAAGIPLLGKPVFAYANAACPLSASGTTGNWLRRNSNYYCANTVQNSGSFATWYTDSALSSTVPGAITLQHCGSAIAPNDPVCATGDENTFLFDSNKMLPDGTACGTTCDGFFPLDAAPATDTNAGKYGDCGAGSPNGQLDQHNFSFTSEVRYWFQYDAVVQAKLTFTGDDDVFVFVNGRLVVDIGGIHNRLVGSVTLNAGTLDVSSASLNLQQGSIYEIGVFQAERNTCASNYRLQLKNFVLARSVCHSQCGDGVVTPDEACDDGPGNVTPKGNTYGKCTTSCQLGPRCGDGIVQTADGEQCDNGLNNDPYMTSQFACGPGCQNPPRCGDGHIDSAAGEICDDGAANRQNPYGPALCTTTCQPAPYCGDHSVDAAFGEICDDGVNSGTPGSCTPDCKGSVPLASCGNGKLESGEQCDDGASNGTTASTCDVRCHLKCGNGIKDTGEECDDGVNDGSYGGCNPDCTLGPYCGDGVKNGPEQCDQGNQNQTMPYGPGLCTTTCSVAPYCGDRRIQTAFGEQCDGGAGCGNDCKTVIPK